MNRKQVWVMEIGLCFIRLKASARWQASVATASNLWVPLKAGDSVLFLS
jgi:hypothetical protein